jgi:hypothetical protein
MHYSSHPFVLHAPHISSFLTCRGSSGQRSQYGFMTLVYQRFIAVLLLIRGSLFLSGVYDCLRFSNVLHNDIAPAHTALSVTDFLSSKLITVLWRFPSSPDLAHIYFFLFPKIIEILKVRHFNDIDDITVHTTVLLKDITQNQFQNCFKGCTRSGIGAELLKGSTLKATVVIFSN